MDNPKTTKQIAGRTALITLFTIVMVLMLSFNILALSAPGLVGDAANRIGMGGVSVSFSRGQYERSKDIEDLGTLCERAVAYGKYDTAKTYLAELMAYDREGESLKTLAARKNASPSVRDYDYEAYIVGNYALSLYKTGERERAFTFARERTASYTRGNALGYVADAYVADDRRDPAYPLAAYLAEWENRISGTGSEEDKLLCIDLYRIYRALGEEEKMREYHDKLQSFV